MACDVCQGRGSHSCPVCGERKAIRCPQCDGYGIVDCVAYKLGSEETLDVSSYFFSTLPFDEEGAHFREDKLFRGESLCCPLCEGLGRVYRGEDGEYYPTK